jgi:hypothetical protein
MSRAMRILLTVLGGLVVFAGFAITGYAVANRMAGDSGAREVEMARYPALPVDGATQDDVLDWVTEQQDRTALAMTEDAESEAGNPAAGGQSIRVVREDSGVAGSDAETTGTTTVETGEGSGIPEGAIPPEVISDAPFLAGLVDLSDVVIADPIGSLDIDICAGSERLPSTPVGCPPGFGGTIIPFDGDLTPGGTEQSGRPPTGFTASGTDTLYVRTFRRSSVSESVRVRAIEWSDEWSGPEEGCNPGDGVPESDAIFPVTTIPITGTTNPEAWPYDPDFDTLEVFALRLQEGTDYAVCSYWVDSSGVGLAVTYWEGTRIVTASARRVTVTLSRWDTVNFRDVDHHIVGEIDRVQFSARCEGGQTFIVDWPGEGRYQGWDSPAVVCEITHLSDLLVSGGIPMTAQLSYFTTAGDPETLRVDVWLDIDRSDILCRVDCVESAGAGFPLPDVEHEEYEPTDFRSAIPPNEWSAGRWGVIVDFSDPSGTSHGWSIGEPVSFDTSDRVVEPPPVVTSFSMVERRNELSYEVGEHSYATSRRFVLRNDEPVSAQVEVFDWEGGSTVGGTPCTPPGTPVPAYENLTPATEHDIQLDGLCLGEDYLLQVTVTDEDGTTYDLTDRRMTGDFADKYTFNTRYRTGPALTFPMYVYDLHAELVLGPEEGNACFMVGDLHANGVASPIDNSRASRDAIVAWDTARWGQDSTMPRFVREEPTSTAPSPPLTFDIRDAEAHELGNRVSISVDYVPNTTGRICRRHSYLDATDLGLSAVVTLTDLSEGVTITNGTDPYPLLRLQAGPVTTRRR